MQIGKIVESVSHAEYVCEITHAGKKGTGKEGVTPASYALGTFLMVGSDERAGIVGVVTDTRLVDPAYARFGLRALSEEDLSMFAPDYLDERTTLITIFPVGRISGKSVVHGIPPETVPLGTPVLRLGDEDVRHFHTPEGRFRIGYFGDLPRAGSCAGAVRRGILVMLKGLMPEHGAALDVLLRTLDWRRMEGGG